MKRSEFYGFRLPERGAREGEANDPADIEDLTYDLGLIDTELERQRVEDEQLEKNKAGRAELLQHTGSTDNPHKVTKEQVGLGNVPNVGTNDQTPVYEAADAPAELKSGETLSAAFGKLAAAVSALIAHLADSVKHITASERQAWDSASRAKHTHGNKAVLDTYEQTEEDLAAAVSSRHTHGNKAVLDGITKALVDRWNTVTEKLPLAGGTLTGPLTLHAAPTEDLHAASKKYVDDTMAETGSGDMTKAVYDTDGDGVVDDAGKLGGNPPEYYAGTKAVADALEGKAAASHTHTQDEVGLGNVDNTADSAKSVKYADSAGSATTATTANGLSQSVINSILLAAHPVGSLYWSSSSTSPATLFGGTWVRITNRFVYALADGTAPGATGGGSTINLQHTHTTGDHANTVQEMPPHGHTGVFVVGGSWEGATSAKLTGGGSWYNIKDSTSSTGGGKAHNHGPTGNALSTAQSIMPPYYAAYCWRRTT